MKIKWIELSVAALAFAAAFAAACSVAEEAPSPILVNCSSTNATHMLQLMWEARAGRGGVQEDLFWFHPEVSWAVEPTNAQQSPLTLGSLYSARRIVRATESDSPEGWSRTRIGFNASSSTNISINVYHAWGSWKDKETVNKIEEVLSVPLRESDQSTQGDITFRSRWWRIAQQNKD